MGPVKRAKVRGQQRLNKQAIQSKIAPKLGVPKMNAALLLAAALFHSENDVDEMMMRFVQTVKK